MKGNQLWLRIKCWSGEWRSRINSISQPHQATLNNNVVEEEFDTSISSLKIGAASPTY